MTRIVSSTSGSGNNVDADTLTALGSAPVTSFSSTKVVFDLGGGSTFALIGSGFSGFDANGVPNAGTITQIVSVDGGHKSTWSAFSVSFTSFWSDVQAADVAAFDNLFFAGADTFISHNQLTTVGSDQQFFGWGGNDIFDMRAAVAGAYASIEGGDGNDTIRYGANFDPSRDTVDGGAGKDTLSLSGDYSGGLSFLSATLANIEQITLGAGFDYSLTTADANVAAGKMLVINGLALGAGDSLVFHGSAELDGRFTVYGGAGNDQITGGAGADMIEVYQGGNDQVNGGGGNDKIEFNGAFTSADVVNGGTGSDRLTLAGDYSAGVTFASTTMTGVETIVLGTGHSYSLTTDNANVAASQVLKVDGAALGVSDTLTFDGSHETDGRFLLTGGAGHDTLTGGAGADRIQGGGSADLLNGGSGHDIFVYGSASESLGSANGGAAGSGFDTISGFDALQDRFDLWFTVSAIDATVGAGLLRQPLFDTDLGNALGAAQLGAHDAVVFTPTSGDYNGHTFLIVDANGTAGYQAGGDLVLDITGASHLASLSTGLFI